MRDSEEYIISMADKTHEDINSQEELKSRHYLRMEFWKMLLIDMNSKSSIYQNISLSKDHWLSAGSGIGGVTFNFVVSRNYVRVEVSIARASTDENKFIFDELFEIKDSIESEFGNEMEWERLDHKKSCRIKSEMKGVSVFNKYDWVKMIDFMTDGMVRLEKAFKETLKSISMNLKLKEF